jgi:hypothetical protein
MQISVKNKRIATIAIGILSLMLVFFEPGSAFASAITSEKMVELTNESRIEVGLGKLTVNSKLMAAADKKARDMMDKQYFEHISPSGVTPWFWFDLVGYDYIYAAENLAIDFVTAEGAHSALMKSIGHRENILGANYKEIGIAALPGTFEGNETVIIVEEFGATKDQRTEAFFENRGSVKASSNTAPPAHATVSDKTSIESETELEPIDENPPAISVNISPSPKTPVENATSDKGKPFAGGASEKNNSEGANEYGKVVTGTFSIKNIGKLKKAYTENIYWRRSEGGTNLIASSRAKLKYILKNMVKSL